MFGMDRHVGGDLVAAQLTLQIEGAMLVDTASLSLKAGTLNIIIGPNGAGKTSLLRMLAGLVKPSAGSISIDNVDLAHMRPVQRARNIGYLPQTHSLAWPMHVRDVVALGRFAYGARPERLSTQDNIAIDAAMTSTGCANFADRNMHSLSGGETARVHLARLLAGETPILIADEPIAALDPRHQRDTLAVFKVRANEGARIILVLHDVRLAAQFADRLIWMQSGRIVADGTVGATLTPDRLADVFALTATEAADIMR
jgi:iron complex transport system ATP-binding protein